MASRRDFGPFLSENDYQATRAAARRNARSGLEYYEISGCPSLPQIGSRVRRGRNWSYGNQDSRGVGTVIGHGADGMNKA